MEDIVIALIVAALDTANVRHRVLTGVETGPNFKEGWFMTFPVVAVLLFGLIKLIRWLI